MVGGTSHLESFDPKPALNKYAGKTIAETPFASDASTHPSEAERPRTSSPDDATRSHPPDALSAAGRLPEARQSGIEVSDWWPHVGDCVDDIAVVRSMWTTDNDHGAQLQFHTGRHVLEGPFPDDRLVGPLRPGLAQRQPAAVRRPRHAASPTAAAAWAATAPATSAPSTPACSFTSIPRTRCRSPRPGPRRLPRGAGAASSSCSAGSTGSAAIEYPDDPALRARIKSYELAFRMQTAVPEVLEFADEEPSNPATLRPGPRRRPARFGAAVPARPAAGRARRALRADLPRRRRRRRLGRPRRPAAEPRDALRPGRQADRRPAQGPQAARPARRDARRLGHRVRPHARRPGRRRPRPPSVRLLASGWPAAASRAASSTARPTSSASTPSRTATTSPTSTPPSCTSSASTRAGSRSPAASGWRSTSASRYLLY